MKTSTMPSVRPLGRRTLLVRRFFGFCLAGLGAQVLVDAAYVHPTGVDGVFFSVMGSVVFGSLAAVPLAAVSTGVYAALSGRVGSPVAVGVAVAAGGAVALLLIANFALGDFPAPARTNVLIAALAVAVGVYAAWSSSRDARS